MRHGLCLLLLVCLAGCQTSPHAVPPVSATNPAQPASRPDAIQAPPNVTFSGGWARVSRMR